MFVSVGLEDVLGRSSCQNGGLSVMGLRLENVSLLLEGSWGSYAWGSRYTREATVEKSPETLDAGVEG